MITDAISPATSAPAKAAKAKHCLVNGAARDYAIALASEADIVLLGPFL